MAELDDWILQQLSPYFVPGETPLAVALTRNVVSLVTAAMSGGPRGVHQSAHYKYTALTTEHLFFMDTSAQMGMMGGLTGEQENKGVQAFLLLELTGVKQETLGQFDTLTFFHRDGRELQQTIVPDKVTTTQHLLFHPHAAGLAQALASGSLRTPERLARMAELDARLAAERAAAEQAAAADAVRAGERLVLYNAAEQERIKRTIDKQPETIYRSGIATVVVGALAVLGILYNAWNAVSCGLESMGHVAEAAKASSGMNRKHAEGLASAYAVRAVTHTVFGFGFLVAAAGAAGGAFYFRKRFRKENAQLRATYGLP